MLIEEKEEEEEEKKEMTEINLRSEEVQDLMGYIPPWIERWGIIVIALILTIVFTGAVFFPYPDTLNGKFYYIPGKEEISVQPIGFAMLPAKGIGRVKQGMTVKVMLENYPEEEFGYLTGEVLGVSDIHDKAGFYKVSIDFNNGMKTSNGFAVPSDVQMVGNAKIVIAEKRLIEKLGIFGKYH